MDENDREMLTIELAWLQDQDQGENYDRSANEDTFEARERYAQRLRRKRPEGKSKSWNIESPDE